MTYIKGENINEITLELLNLLNNKGTESTTRAGDVKELYNVDIELTNPNNRHLNLLNRGNNIYTSIAEVLWVLSGSDKIDPFLSTFLPRSNQYSDDGYTWRGAYGPRLYDCMQVSNILEVFEKEGINTRRAVFSIWESSLDTLDSISDITGQTNTRDIPCTLGGLFWVHSGKLHMKIIMRSNDALWGLSHIDILQWTTFHELILTLLNKKLGLNLQLGSYYHSVTNLHFYTLHQKKVEMILTSNSTNFYQESNYKIRVPYQEYFVERGISKFISEIMEVLMQQHSGYLTSLEDGLFRLNFIFEENYDVKKDNNLIYSYSLLLLIYTFLKSGSEIPNNKLIKNLVSNYMPPDIIDSIKGCVFTPTYLKHLL